MNAQLQALPYIITVAGAGYFSVTDYQNDLWVSNIVANKPGDGNKLVSALKKYAKDRGKTIYGYINPMSEGLSKERLELWYARHGGEVINDNIIKY